jgi:hypothetical protein
MGKSLTETAKSILMNEGAVPSVSSSDNDPYRDATSTTVNKSSLRPGAKSAESRFSTPGATAPSTDAVDLGGATQTSRANENLGEKGSAKVGKDTSKSAKSAVPAEKAKKQAEVMEEDVEIDEENIEISEELEAFIAEMVEEGYSEEQIALAIDENFEIVSEASHKMKDKEEEDDEEDEEKMEEEYEVDMSEHVEALFAGEELSEEFKTKALTIFEAAVRQKVEEEIALLEAAYAETLEEQIAQIQEDLSSNVDDYLNYVVEQWVGENEVAIQAGLRSELTEDFISGLRNLFSEHYIDIPEDRVNVVEEMGSTVANLEQKLNEEIERNVQLTRFLNESKQNEILSDAAHGLTDTQAEKLKSLSEGIDFTSVNEYAQKINILRESYFSSSVNSDNALDRTESYGDGKSMISEELNGPMAAYVKTLGRTVK